jgi:hypothetical protein
MRTRTPTYNPHSPDLDTTGRVDVLASRLLRMAVERVQDPVLKVLYAQLQPVADQLIHANLRTVNCTQLFRQIGLAPHDPKPKAQKFKGSVKKVGKAKSAKPKSGARVEILDAEVTE